jgi:Protein of unknown function (DUF3313)
MSHYSAIPPSAAALACLTVLCGCAAAPLTESGALASYAQLEKSDGYLTRTRQKVDKAAVLAAQSVQLRPTRVAASATTAGLTPGQLSLVANAVDRALCSGLSARFIVVPAGAPADLAVEAVITHLGVTGTTAAAASKVVNAGGIVVSATTGLPVQVPRLPFGLGGLSVEAKADAPAGQQIAAMTWARGADVLTTRARVSEEGDAYALATEFAGDFSRLLITGTDPINNSRPQLTSMREIKEFFGADPKHAACATFGGNPGLADAIGGTIGLPPSWTDRGGASAAGRQ